MSFNLSVVLRETAATSPGRTCMVLGERRWTFREVDAAADLVAANLRALGLEPGATIGVQLDRIRPGLRAGDRVLMVGLGGGVSLMTMVWEMS